MDKTIAGKIRILRKNIVVDNVLLGVEDTLQQEFTNLEDGNTKWEDVEIVKHVEVNNTKQETNFEFQMEKESVSLGVQTAFKSLK